MDHRNEITKSIIVLFVLFCAIVLSENVTGAVSSTVALLMGVILISLCLASILFNGKKDTEIREPLS